MQRLKQSYTIEFKQRAVELSNTLHRIVWVARELGTSAENIRRWKNQLEDGRLGNKTKQTTESKLQQIKRLKKELAEVKFERDILRKASNILASETQIKYKFIKEHRQYYPVEKICKILKVSKSGYYYWYNRKPSKWKIGLTEHPIPVLIDHRKLEINPFSNLHLYF